MMCSRSAQEKWFLMNRSDLKLWFEEIPTVPSTLSSSSGPDCLNLLMFFPPLQSWAVSRKVNAPSPSPRAMAPSSQRPGSAVSPSRRSPGTGTAARSRPAVACKWSHSWWLFNFRQNPALGWEPAKTADLQVVFFPGSGSGLEQ